jgi:hypothetical protein
LNLLKIFKLFNNKGSLIVIVKDDSNKSFANDEDNNIEDNNFEYNNDDNKVEDNKNLNSNRITETDGEYSINGDEKLPKLDKKASGMNEFKDKPENDLFTPKFAVCDNE